MKLSLIRLLVFLSIVLLSLFFWLVFYPALMNADSIVQYQQALSGAFDDWHPPIISIIVFYILQIGGNIGTVTLAQVFLGFFGVHLFARELLDHFNLNGRIEKELYPLLILLILASPLSAFSYYMLSFIKDSWLAIDLIWIAYIGLALMRKTKFSVAGFAVLIFTMTIALLIRHNSLVLLPVFFLIIFLISIKIDFAYPWMKNGTPILFAFAPLIFFLLLNSVIYSIYEVKRTQPFDQVIAMESLGALVEDPKLKNELVYLSAHLTPNYKKAYLPGNVAPVMHWGPIKAVDKDFDIHHVQLKQEYFGLYFSAPHTLAKVKIDGFLNMLFPEYRYWFHPQLDHNQFGLVQNENYSALRHSLLSFSQSIYSNDFFSLFFGEHYTWLFINVLVLVYILSRKKVDWKLFAILLLPLFYYLSYFIAATGPQFRFMFPATLIVQVVVLTWLISLVEKESIKKLIRGFYRKRLR